MGHVIKDFNRLLKDASAIGSQAKNVAEDAYNLAIFEASCVLQDVNMGKDNKIKVEAVMNMLYKK